MKNKLVKAIIPTIILTIGLSSKSFAGNYVDCNKNNTNISLNGKQIYLDAYNIKGNNYFKLRDLGDLLDFNVDWDEGTKQVIIDM